MIVRRAMCLACGLLLAAPFLPAQAADPGLAGLARPLLSIGSPLPVEMPGPFPSPPDSLVRAALAYLGVPYVSGGESHAGPGLLRAHIPGLS